MRTIILSILFVFISGCASTVNTLVLNGDTPQTMKADIDKVVERLPGGKKEDFLIALLSIQMAATDNPFAFLGNPDGDAINYELLAKELDGLSYRQVMKRAAKSNISVTKLSEIKTESE